MEAVRNPYGPGAGTPPPELSGRSVVLADADIALQRKLAGRSHKSLILVGLRGVGKTVLLNSLDELARKRRYHTAFIEISEDTSLPQTLAPTLRSILYELDRMADLSESVKRGFRVLRSFVGTLSVRTGDLELSIEPEIGTADSGNLDTDLAQLFVAVGEAAASRKVAVALIVDELQYLKKPEFGALITALHRVTQLKLPVLLMGAGLPSVRGLAGRAKSYAERLFEFPVIGPLDLVDTRDALQVPARREGVDFSDLAVAEVQRITQGYPYFLQQWAYDAWNTATSSTITANDVRAATDIAIRRLDEGFFGVRFDRLTNSEKKYLRAMAQLGPGPYRSSDVAAEYGAKVTSVGPIRATLIQKGMIYSPSHGDTAFTVPLFDKFMQRTMPRTHPAAIQ